MPALVGKVVYIRLVPGINQHGILHHRIIDQRSNVILNPLIDSCELIGVSAR